MGNSKSHRPPSPPSPAEQPKKGVPKEGILYDAYRKSILPLDLVFFQGTDFTSSIIQFAENVALEKANYNITTDTFTHLGIVVTTDILDDDRLEPGKLYLLESTVSGIGDDTTLNIDGIYSSGVQIRDLDILVNDYDRPNDAAVAICHMSKGIFDHELDMNERFRDIFTDVYKKYSNVEYNDSHIALASSAWSCLRPLRRQSRVTAPRKLFCSEFIASLLIDVGLLPDSVIPANVVPMDFFGFDCEGNLSQRVPVIVERPVAVVSMFHFRSQQDETLVSDVNLDIDWFGEIQPQTNPATYICGVIDTTQKRYYPPQEDSTSTSTSTDSIDFSAEQEASTASG